MVGVSSCVGVRLCARVDTGSPAPSHELLKTEQGASEA